MAMKILQGKVSTLKFIDFDGVFCDSLSECYYSAYDAYFRLHLRSLPAATTLADRARFDSYRPFIRRGGDYVLLQHCVHEGIILHTQADFDRIVAELTPLVDQFHTLFYQARKELLAADREFWYSLNRLYDGFTEAARDWARDEECYVLSTKEAAFVREILLGKGIEWPLERIICSGKRVKAEIISEWMEKLGADKALLFEDQIDHLLRIGDRPISGYLASWGYIKPEWLTQQEVPVINRDEMIRLIAAG